MTERMAVIDSLKDTVFILTGELAIIHCLSNSPSSTMFIPEKSWLHYAFFQRYYNYFYKILAAIYSFNGAVHFPDVKTCSHPILPKHFLFPYFRTLLT